MTSRPIGSSSRAIVKQQYKGNHMNHKLDLLGNAMDSLEEALKKFEEGDAGDQKAYKC